MPSALNSRVVVSAVAVVAVAKLPSSAIMSARAPVISPTPAARPLFVFNPSSAVLIDVANNASL